MSEAKSLPDQVDVHSKLAGRIGNFSLAVTAALLATATCGASTPRPAVDPQPPLNHIRLSGSAPADAGNLFDPAAFKLNPAFRDNALSAQYNNTYGNRYYNTYNNRYYNTYNNQYYNTYNNQYYNTYNNQYYNTYNNTYSNNAAKVTP